MDEKENNSNVSYEIRVKPGREGTDPNAPDWEVRELENGVLQNDADIYDNLTLAEANEIAGMWIRKKNEAEAETEN
ncbi:MAG TPA: hypothetical protein VF708_21335 [Pyrinomonadaceae bacterium]|jgi:hypothetical protein